MAVSGGYFQQFIENARDRTELVVQPRMGFGALSQMRAGLASVASLPCTAIGTITLDSYTRVGDYQSALQCLNSASPMNGFPIISHPLEAVRDMLEGIYCAQFPIQIRHGTAQPQQVFQRLAALGLDATEGGPVSYCMPYSRLPLARAVAAWAQSCQLLAGLTEHAHIESFGGCLLGQLCPPSLLIAMTLLEALFFRQHGVLSVSLSYAQGTSLAQDLGALQALRELASEYLAGAHWHVVVYCYMGVFPSTDHGARRLIADSARLARSAACERLIVKTCAESRQIPSVADNLEALRLAAESAADETLIAAAKSTGYYQEVLLEARRLIETVLNLHADIGAALIQAFARGWLDIPYCLHPDNPAKTTCRIDQKGALRWANTGRLPLPRSSSGSLNDPGISSAELLQMLHYTVNRYDRPLH
ncbi:methylaspartate mutase [Pseudomonas sp. 5P_3.1_Bac2]|uniref:methylaspartate mutase n=1 Tax=Pseudomonas sp. 5P_3.1_Bac2 TaxID=2971617 RepID=UPI0021C67641|nr:methylaspartate mutase [Pseudomonas sp. 5P_3.1_Bac2]MCU1719023.1 methylaspartate mutase [Pseudomonas sp. 5P_3.1_Bac2]